MDRHPEFLLKAEDKSGLEKYLHARRWIDDGETLVSLSKPGPAGMNFVLRVKTDRRGLILKQSRPWVEKTPQLAAPSDRVAREGLFYKQVSALDAVAGRMPKFIGVDEAQFILCLEDLGPIPDFSFLYGGKDLSDGDCAELLDYLSTLHRLKIPSAEAREFENKSMRRLNHEQSFDLPLRQKNGLNLDAFTPGLKAVAESLKIDAPLVEKVQELGKIYLAKGETLIHGEFYPLNWLQSKTRVFVIDPEFCLLGRAEYDVGLLIAHLLISGSYISFTDVLEGYRASKGFEPALALQFAGVEIIKRLLGVVPLPLRWKLNEKADLLETAREFILHSSPQVP